MDRRSGTRTVKAAAVVGLVIGAAVVALVSSEWPGVEGSLRPASPSAALLTARPTGGESPPQSERLYPLVSIVSSGGAEEARRQAREASQIGGGFEVEQGIDLVLPDLRIDSLGPRPTRDVLGSIGVYDPSWSGGRVAIAPSLDALAGRTVFNAGDTASLGSLGSEARPGRDEGTLYQADLRLEPLSVGGLEVGLLAGGRAAELRGESPRESPVAVGGGDVSLRWAEDALLRASAVGSLPGEERDYLDLRLQQVWRLGGRSSISMGWQHLRGVMSNDAPELDLRRDNVLLELRFGF